MSRFAPFALFGALLMTGCAADARSQCFAPGTELPAPDAVLAQPGVGESAKHLVDALTSADVPAVRRLLAADPALARLPLGKGADMLSLGVASCEHEALDLLIAAGAPLDGAGASGLPLTLALRARDPWFTTRLLSAGAAPEPEGAPILPLRTAIGLNSIAGVDLLLDAGADPDVAERTGRRPLHVALDMERFRIAERLIERGADPWAIDSGGANLATATVTEMLTDDDAEAAAQKRLRARVAALGWPEPLPTPRAIRALALEGKWPPAGSGAAAVPASVVELIRERTR